MQTTYQPRLYGKDKVRDLIERQRARIERNRAEAEQRRFEEQRILGLAKGVREARIRNHEEILARPARARRQRLHLDSWHLNFGRNNVGLNHDAPVTVEKFDTVQESLGHSRRGLEEQLPLSSAASPGSKSIQFRSQNPLGQYTPSDSHFRRNESSHYKTRVPLVDSRRVRMCLPLFGSSWSQSLDLLRRGAEVDLNVRDLGTLSGAGLYTSTPNEQRSLGSSVLLGAGRTRASPKIHNDTSELDETGSGDDEFSDSENDIIWRTDIKSLSGKDRLVVDTMFPPPNFPPAFNHHNQAFEARMTRYPNHGRTHGSGVPVSHQWPSIPDSSQDIFLNAISCRHTLISELARFHVVFTPLSNRLNRFKVSMLRLAFQRLWRHVEDERARMFALGESRLNHRKARKHDWFTRVGKSFSIWKRAARQSLEARLRLALLLRKKRVTLLHDAFRNKWRPYTDALRAHLQRKLNRALAYWRNSGMMRAFMGWRASVSQGLALRAALRISDHWRMQYQCGGAIRRWYAETVATRLRLSQEKRILGHRMRRWIFFVSDSQAGRRYLQRAGRRWRNSLKQRCLRRLKVATKTRVRLRSILLKAASSLGVAAALKWAMHRWIRVMQSIIERESQERAHAKMHEDGLCDCVRSRFGPIGGRARMLQWRKEEAEEKAWLQKEKLRRQQKKMKGQGNVNTNDAHAEKERKQRRKEFRILKKRRKKRLAIKKKMKENAKIRARERHTSMMVNQAAGKVRAPFRCSLEVHLARRLNDAYTLVNENLHSTLAMNGADSTNRLSVHSTLDSDDGGANKQVPLLQNSHAGNYIRKKHRRMSSVLRESHWI